MGRKLVLISILMLSIVGNVEAENNCLFYAYTEDNNHKFLLDSNVKLYDNRLTVIHNCHNVKLYQDGVYLQGSLTNFTVILEGGYSNLSLIGNNDTIENYENVEIIESRFTWLDEYRIIEENSVNNIYNQEDVNSQITVASIGTGLIIWFCCVVIYWKLINHYVDRNYFQEVI